MQSRFTLFFLIFLLRHFAVLGQNNPSAINIGETHTLYSDILKEERKYLVYVPPSHKDVFLTETYPVLYILDGDWYFHATTGIIEYSKGSFKMPEMIVVAISSTDRIKDMTPSHANTNMFGDSIPGLENSGGGEDFIAFLKNELIPHIDTTYRASDFTLFAGHSFGGLLGNHILTTSPELFNAYVLIDPSLWWNEGNQLAQTQRKLEESPDLGTTLYFGEADNAHTETTDNSPHIEAMFAYKNLIRAHAPSGLRYRFDSFPGETHASVGLPAMYQGLSFLFEGYRPADSVFQQAAWVSKHYERLSKKYHAQMLPPESLVRNLGWGAQYGEKDLEKAMTFFKMNLKNYPRSSNAHKIMGEAYEMAGKPKEAMAYYDKAQKLNPADASILEKIKNLSQNK